ncbi:RluA family pseudouridine synthase [Luteibaculum oceani]|uniref:RNA pseudouridine synthase n=1 Tax=Luteibaculum oceani TaxID=1294296 RepID=A0A5C6V4D9_9FLAO|nr:RNA pseudouridine synthase [Luteibaculum oceani]TXC78598.1 RNA pseudouridine synthase [Luteibaculum oceani]
MEVLYEDNHIIAINKKAGDLVQGDKTGDTPLPERVKQYLKDKYNKPGEVFLGVTHRLDRPTTGVVLFARTSKALSRLNEMFKKHAYEKVYWAVVEGKLHPEENKLQDYLVKDEKRNKSRVCAAGTKGAKEAKLSYKLIQHLDNYSCAEVLLETGRHHQIRCQLSAKGFSIKGDVKYGARRANKDGSIHLHARSIKFIHPVKKEEITIIAPPPRDAIWDKVIQKTN